MRAQLHAVSALSLLMALTARAQGVVGAPYVGGTLTDSAGAPLARVTLVLTRAPDMRSYTDSTDAQGRFVFANPGGSGEYLLFVNATGFRPFRLRIVPESQSGALVIRLSPWAATLSGITVVAPPSPPSARSVFESSPGSASAVSDGAVAAQALGSGALTSLTASSLLGSSAGNGWSVAGLPPGESATQVNGLLFGGDRLPRTLPKYARLSASSYDVAVGGFSGGLVAIEIPKATEFADVELEVTATRAPSPSFWNGVTSGSTAIGTMDLGGQWRDMGDRIGLTYGIRAETSPASRPTIDALGDAGIRALGADSRVVREIDSLAANTSGTAASRWGFDSRRTDISGLFRLDPSPGRRDGENAFLISFALSSTPLYTQGSIASASRMLSDKQQRVAIAWQKAWAAGTTAWSLRLGASHAMSSQSSPLTPLSLDVTARSTQSDPNYAPVVLSGADVNRQWSRDHGVEASLVRDAFAGVSRNNRWRTFLGMRVDQLSASADDTTAEADFSSVETLKSQTPSWSTTFVGPSRARTFAARFAGGIGDEWRANSAVRVQMGLRSDLQALAAPQVEGSVNSQFLPLAATLSPRLGMSWQFNSPEVGEGLSTTPLFSRYLFPAGVFKIGVGLFQGDLAPWAGLPGRGAWGPVKEQWCWNVEGLALPAPTPVLVPSMTCGVNAQSTERRSVTRLDRGFRAPQSVRSNASLVSRIRNTDVELTGQWNDTRYEPGTQIVLPPLLAQRSLPNEGGRTLFAADSTIDPASGTVRFVTNSNFNVTSVSSDRETRGLQLAASVSPRLTDSHLALRLGYVWSVTRSLQGGWDRDAFGDPTVLEWGPSVLDRRHQFQVELGGEVYRELAVVLWMRAVSGVPYTPLVAGDANGDGTIGNDRAFVPVRSSAQATADGSSLDGILPTFPEGAQQCLASQRGEPAQRGSCRGPWELAGNLLLTMPLRQVSETRRGVLTVSLENIAGGIDHLFYGDRRGWGQPADIDPYLLQTRSYDRATHSFTYSLNPRFGRPRGSQWLGTPARFIVGVQLPMSRPILEQQMRKWLYAQGVGARMSSDSLAARLARNVPAAFDELLAESDEIGLTDAQLRDVTARGRLHDDHVAVAWHELAAHLNSTSDVRDERAAAKLVEETIRKVWEINRNDVRALRGVITPIQEMLVPSTVRMLLAADTPVHTRITYY
jgi:hypothetical protein